MKKFLSGSVKKIEHFSDGLRTRVSCFFFHWFRCLLSSLLDYLNILLLVFSRVRLNPFWIQLAYFIFFSIFGYFALKLSNLKPAVPPFKPLKDIDVLFMSFSAATVSSMSTVEMEVFSNSQLIILTILMLLGGEVFTSMLGLLVKSRFFKNQTKISENKVDMVGSLSGCLINSVQLDIVANEIELGCTNIPNSDKLPQTTTIESSSSDLKLYTNSIKWLGYTVLGYFLTVNVVGSFLVSLYVSYVPSAKQVLEKKGLDTKIFSVFTTVSTFANCGFTPTNENMVVFKKNTGLLLIVIPQILLGNTLYPPFLLLVILVLQRITKRSEFGYILKNYRELGYSHLLPRLHSCFLVLTVLGFIFVQLILFVAMEWNNSGLMRGLTVYEKVVASLFQVVNSRHAGESVFDLSVISPAILVLFIVMMYLPPYTSFFPVECRETNSRNEETSSRKKKKKTYNKYLDYFQLSQLSYLAIFVILICITERKSLLKDPLNFNLLNIIIEVISAYGNVGFTTGYSCQRQVKPEGHCKDTYAGFAGRWSNNGKIILISVMLFGRLKNFSFGAATAWKMS